MRLSSWRTKAPGKGGINPKVIETVGSILAALGAEPDPHCWVTWGDETGGRWSLIAPCEQGMAVVNIRAGGLDDGSRVGGRLVRWSKVQVGELAAEAERGHRLVMFQVEGQPIRGTDDNAADVAAFARLTLAGLEGRPLPDLDRRPAGRTSAPKKAPPAALKARARRAPRTDAGTAAGTAAAGLVRIPARTGPKLAAKVAAKGVAKGGGGGAAKAPARDAR